MNEYIESINYLFQFLLFSFIILILVLIISLFIYFKAKKLDKINEFDHCRIVGKLINSKGENLITFSLFNGNYLTLKTDIKIYSKINEGEIVWIKYRGKQLLECNSDEGNLNSR